MPIRHLATIFSDYMVAGTNGRHTLVRTYQNIQVKQIPATKFPFCFVVEFVGDGEQFRVTLEGPPGSQLLGEGETNPPPLIHEFQQWCVSFAGEMQPGVFPEPGVYSIVLWCGEEEIHRRSFGVYMLPTSDESQAIDQVEA